MKYKPFDDFEKRTGVHVTYNHEGKMRDMFSLSTSALLNPHCIERAKKPGSICAKCYAENMLQYRKGLADCTAFNTAILTTKVIDKDFWPAVDPEIFPYGRFEAYGDYFTLEQVENTFNFCEKNPRVKFAAWTKNPQYFEKTLRGRKKPRNLTIVYSSCMLNRPAVAVAEKYDFIDHVFTVYDKKTAASVNINCGARSCKTCGRCYTKRTALSVNELLK